MTDFFAGDGIRLIKAEVKKFVIKHFPPHLLKRKKLLNQLY